jgi:hypothetical protein
MHYQSIIFHLCYPYDLFASHFQTYAYVLIRWSDYLRVETFLFGACNNVHCKFRFIIGLNYTLYIFFNVNNLLRTRSSLQYEIRRFTWETSYLFIWRVRKVSKSDYWLRHVCLSFCPSVRPSIHPSAWNNAASSQRIFMKFYSWVFFEIYSENSEVSLKYNKKTWRPIYILIHISLSSS